MILVLEMAVLVLSRRRAVMGDLKMGRLGTVTGWSVAALIIGLNVFLLYETFAGGSGGV